MKAVTVAESSSATYTSIEQIREEFYPSGASLLQVGRDEAVEFPISLTDPAGLTKRSADQSSRSTE
jgi:hypothetical protein